MSSPTPPPSLPLAESDLLSVPAAARYSGLSTSTLWRYIKRNQLPKVQHGGHGARVLIRRADLTALHAPAAANAPSKTPPVPTKLSGQAPAWKRSSSTFPT